MGSTMTINDLPFDILSNIHAASADPRDLFNSICTSRVCYRAFSANRDSILTDVLRTSFREHFPEAVAACRAKKVRDEDLAIWKGNAVSEIKAKASGDFLRRLATEFAQGHFTTRNAIKNSDLRVPGLLGSLCNLWYLTEYFIREYKEAVSSSLVDYMIRLHGTNDEEFKKHSELKEACSKPLSDYEYSRIQRAFVHFELFRRIFASAYKNGMSLSTSDYARIFLKYFRPWECEELSCVYQFLVEWLQDNRRRMADKLVAFFEANHAEETGWNQAFTFGAFFPNAFRFGSLMMHDTVRRREHDVDHLRYPLLGLPSLRLFVAADLADQLCFTRTFGSSHHFTTPQATYFEDVLSEYPVGEYVYTEDFDPDDDDGGNLDSDRTRWEPYDSAAFDLRADDVFTKPSSGWLWARVQPSAADATVYLPVTVCRDWDLDLIRMGYVMWDERRLQDVGLLKFKRSARPHEPSFPVPKKDMRSVEERVSAYRVPISVVEERFARVYALPIDRQHDEVGADEWFKTEY